MVDESKACGKMTIEEKEFNSQDLDYAILLNQGLRKGLFHGTRKDLAHQISDSQKIEIGNRLGYLGYGFYCYSSDIIAAQNWANYKWKNEEIAVLVLEADLNNIFQMTVEIERCLIKKVTEIRKGKSHSFHKDVGILMMVLIKRIIEPQRGIHIDTIGRHEKTQLTGFASRQTLIYCIRSKKMIQTIDLYGEK